MTSTIGTRIVGRCFLPCLTADREKGGYDFSFHFRSNLGGLKQPMKFGVELVRYPEPFLKIYPETSTQPLPFYIASEEVHQLKSSFSQESFELVKPNKHYLRMYQRNISCKLGRMEIPLFFKNEKKMVECSLSIYPSVIENREYLVIQSKGVPIQLSR